MRRYLVCFDQGAMDHLDGEGLDRASRESHEVVREARAAGVWVFGGGLYPHPATRVGVDGNVVAGQPGLQPGMGGFCIIESETREQALGWAARLAKACDCDQQVRESMFDAES